MPRHGKKKLGKVPGVENKAEKNTRAKSEQLPVTRVRTKAERKYYSPPKEAIPQRSSSEKETQDSSASPSASSAQVEAGTTSARSSQSFVEKEVGISSNLTQSSCDIEAGITSSSQNESFEETTSEGSYTTLSDSSDENKENEDDIPYAANVKSGPQYKLVPCSSNYHGGSVKAKSDEAQPSLNDQVTKSTTDDLSCSTSFSPVDKTSQVDRSETLMFIRVTEPNRAPTTKVHRGCCTLPDKSYLNELIDISSESEDESIKGYVEPSRGDFDKFHKLTAIYTKNLSGNSLHKSCSICGFNMPPFLKGLTSTIHSILNRSVTKARCPTHDTPNSELAGVLNSTSEKTAKTSNEAREKLNAYVTIMNSVEELPQVLMLAASLEQASLRQAGPKRVIVCLSTVDLSRNILSILRTFFHQVIEINKSASIRMKFPQTQFRKAKLYLWCLEEFGTCVYLDPGLLIVRDPNELFSFEGVFTRDTRGVRDYSNMCLEPCETTVAKFSEVLNGGQFLDEDHLIAMALDTLKKPVLLKLPEHFRFEVPNSKAFNKDIKMVKFIGATFPWNVVVDYEKVAVKTTGIQYSQSHLMNIQEWATVFNQYVIPRLEKNAKFGLGPFETEGTYAEYVNWIIGEE